MDGTFIIILGRVGARVPTARAPGVIIGTGGDNEDDDDDDDADDKDNWKARSIEPNKIIP